MLKTGFVGLGAMGLPMARNLHRAGLLTAVWNRSVEKARALAEETGCIACAAPEQLAKLCDVIVLCISADEDVLEIVGAIAPEVSPGTVVIDCSTVSATTARQAASMLSEKGSGFLDCPVSGGTEGARQGTLSIMAGGAAEDLEKARPVLEAMGRSVVHMGPAGSGQAAKATNQVMVAGINQAVTEALAFGRSQGLPVDALVAALSEGAAGNWFLSHRGLTMVEGRYPLGFKIRLHQKDLAICADMANDKGARLPLVEMTRIHYERLMSRGLGDHDISALFVLKEELFPEQEE
jgi:3-hydroxyisobutyrate dehydrogenase